jgi:DNA helicase-2/ATP-dependent DNA helicase PcrA
MTPRTKTPSSSTPNVASAATDSKRVSQEAPTEAPNSIDNIARFFGGTAGAGKAGNFKPGALPRPAMDIPAASGAAGLKKGQRVRHSKYGEGTVLMREGDGEDAKLTVLFTRHGMKKLMEKFANLQKI